MQVDLSVFFLCGCRNSAHLAAFGQLFCNFGWRYSNEHIAEPSRTWQFSAISNIIIFILTLVGPRTMELGREEIQTDLPRLGEWELS